MAGQSYNLTCNVSEPATVTSYQWKKEGDRLDALNKILIFPLLELFDAGNYTCEVNVTMNQSTQTIFSNIWIIVPQSEFFYNTKWIKIMPFSCSNRYGNSH